MAIERLTDALGDHVAPQPDVASRAAWLELVDRHCAAPEDHRQGQLPTDAQVIGAVQRASTERKVVEVAQ